MRPLTDKKLNDRGSYNFMLSKEGYIPKTVTYNVLFDREGQYEVSAFVDLRMDPVVEDLRDLIQICLLYTSPSPRDLSTSRMPSSA